MGALPIATSTDTNDTKVYTQTGLIIKMTGGLYTVRLDAASSPDEAASAPLAGPLAGCAVECRARGHFRHVRTSPLVGDRVEVQYDRTSYVTDPDGQIRPGPDRSGLMITDILPRRNSLIRPPLANVDIMLVVMAAAAPDPDVPTVDKLLSILEYNRIEPVMVIGKCELAPQRAQALAAVYTAAGYRVFVLSCYTGEGVEAFSAFAHTALQGKITAVAGASGAGKSTLLNTVFPGLELVTGHISEKIGRGKNTTRHTELFDLPTGGYIADTAGFSLLDFERFDFFALEDLPHTFREFAPYLGHCRYTDCTHMTDEGCAIVEAVRAGEIGPSRHKTYRELYTILKEKKKW